MRNSEIDLTQYHFINFKLIALTRVKNWYILLTYELRIDIFRRKIHHILIIHKCID